METKPPYGMQDNCAYWAMYLNSARFHAYITLNAIAQKLGVSQCGEDALDKSPALDELSSTKEDHATRALVLFERHFPFLVPMSGSAARLKDNSAKPAPVQGKKPIYKQVGTRDDVGAYVKILKQLFRLLNGYRNAFTHAGQAPVRLDADSPVLKWLHAAYDDGVREIKDKRALAPAQITGLERREMDKREVIEKPYFAYAFADKNDPALLTEKGLAFFICLFLDPHSANQFLKRLTHFKDGRDATRRATLEVYCFYQIRVARDRMVSDNRPQALLMDIVNELQRIPQSLFEVVSDTDRQEFRPARETQSFEALDAAEEERGEADEQGLPEETKLTRKTSRFAYLALRYLEDSPYFGRLFPQIDLGDYFYRVYEKQTLGQTVHRRLKHNLLAFGHLKNFDRENRPESWKPLVRETGDDGTMQNAPLPFITDATPHYHFVGERMLFWVNVRHPDNTYAPDWPSLDVAKKGAPIAYQCWMSTYDFPALVLWVHLLEIKAKEVENKGDKTFAELLFRTLHDGIRNSRKLLADIANGSFPPLTEADDTARKAACHSHLKADYALSIADVPERLVSFLCDVPRKADEERATKRLEAMIRTTGSRLMRLKRERSKAPKKGKDMLKGGWMADWLAEDMMRFQPVRADSKGKANDPQYRIMQQRLAFFGRDKDMLGDTFRELNLVDSTNPHAFLNTMGPVGRYAGIIDYFAAYLEARKIYLEACLRKPANYGSYFFLRMRPSINGDAAKVKALAQELLKMPVNLPRGLFFAPTEKALRELNNTALTAALDAQPKNNHGEQIQNSAFLLKAYLTHVLQDQPQPYFAFPRSHRFAAMMSDTRTDQFVGLPPKYLTPTQIAKSYKGWMRGASESALQEELVRLGPGGDEKEIMRLKSLRKQFREMKAVENEWRQYQTEDIALYLVATQLFTTQQARGQTVQEVMKRLPLRNIRPAQSDGQSLLAQKHDYAQRIEVSASGKKVTDVKKKEYREVYQPDLKLKNFGDFLRFTLDTRLQAMLFYFPQEKLLRAGIEYELKKYDEVRYRVFVAVLDFERTMLARYGNDLEQKVQADVNRQHNTMLEYYFAQNPLGSEQEGKQQHKRMSTIRNKFSHNEFPAFGTFPNAAIAAFGNEPAFKDFASEFPAISAEWKARYDAAEKNTAPYTYTTLAERFLGTVEETYIAYTTEMKKHPACAML